MRFFATLKDIFLWFFCPFFREDLNSEFVLLNCINRQVPNRYLPLCYGKLLKNYRRNVIEKLSMQKLHTPLFYPAIWLCDEIEFWVTVPRFNSRKRDEGEMTSCFAIWVFGKFRFKRATIWPHWNSLRWWIFWLCCNICRGYFWFSSQGNFFFEDILPAWVHFTINQKFFFDFKNLDAY